MDTRKNTFDIRDLLGKEIQCECGRKHSADIEKIIIEPGATERVTEILNYFGYKNIFMVADSNTYKAAGERIEKLVTGGGFNLKKHVYVREGSLVPNEAALGEFMVNFYNGADVILAVGSGVINDICKFISYKLGIPYIIAATAPSMDGYASTVSPLIINNMKITYSATAPKAIIGDVDILKNAPMQMIRAGFGDVIGKFSAINDWKLSRLINDEYYCSYISDLVMHSLRKCMNTAEGLQKRDGEAIKNLMESLVLTGIAMSFAGNSRPASGSEHHLAHFIEIMYLFDGKESPLHGIDVGFSTIITCYIREKITETNPDLNQIKQKALNFDMDKWYRDINKLYRQGAQEIITLKEKEGVNSYGKRMERVKQAINKWDEVVNILKEMPSHEEIIRILKKAGLPVTPKELGVDKKIIPDGTVYAKEVRNRYTVLQLAWDLGILEEMADEVQNTLFGE